MAATAMRFEAFGKDVRRLSENIFDGAKTAVKAGDEIVRDTDVRARSISIKRLAPVNNGRQHFVVNNNKRCCIFRQRPRFSNDDCHRNADMAHFALRQRLIVQRLLDDGDGHHMGQRLTRDLAKIGGRIDGKDARNRLRRRGVDLENSSMSINRTHKGRVRNAGNRQVVEISALPRNQLGIFNASDFSTKIADTHQRGLRITCAASSAAFTIVS